MPCSSCAAAKGEFKRPMFDLVEGGSGGGDNEGEGACRRLDVTRTFSPGPRVPCIAAKAFIAAWLISIMVVNIGDYRHPSFWLAYITNWTFVFTSAYMIMSVFVAVYLAVRPPSDPGALEGALGVCLKTTWALLACSAPAGVVITVLYWVLLFDGSTNYQTVMLHGMALLLVMIDGFVLSRIPFRAKQFWLFEGFAFLYAMWTIIHAYVGVGNPYAEDDPESTDDAIYYFMAWKTDAAGAATLSVLLLLVANPIVFLICWALSRALPRRLCDEEKTFEGQENGAHGVSQTTPVAVDEEAAAAVVY